MSTWTVHCTQFEHMQRICITRLETLWQLLKFEIILSYNHKISNVNQYSLYDLWLKCCMTELFQLSQRTELHYHLSVWRQALQWVTKNSKISSYPHSGQSRHNSYNYSYTLSSNFVTKNLMIIEIPITSIFIPKTPCILKKWKKDWLKLKF